MGDNIKDAALKGMPAPAARRGWIALSEEARAQGYLAAEAEVTCMRLFGGRLLLDRTASFSEGEFYRVRREYEKYGIKDIWVIGPNSGVSKEFLKRNKDTVLVMLHADRKDGRFLIDGLRYSISGGLKYMMTGEKDPTTVVSPRVSAKLSMDRLHRNTYRKLSLRSEKPAAAI